MKSLYFKRTLVSLACIGLLAGCVEDEDSEDTSTSTYVVYAMTEVSEDYQTFQQRALDYDDVDEDEDESTYIYKDREIDDSSDVVFYSANSSDTDTEDLVVSDATDINDTYTAFSLDDVTIKVESVNYSGDYILVQEKESGELYPVVAADYVPLYSSELSDDIYWMSTYRNSNLADEDRIYLNDSADQLLYIFEFDGDYFTYIDTYEYGSDDFWINEDGDILTKSASNSKYFTFYDRDDDSELSEELSYAYMPFLYDGEFYGVRNANDNIYQLVEQSSSFYMDPSDYWTNDEGYEPAITSVRRGGYEMTADCQLYQIEDSNPYAITIDLIYDFEDEEGYEYGQLAVAGQDALFCVSSTGSGDSATPTILKYDLDEEEATYFTTTDGNLSDATDYFTVISDDEVMFSEEASGTFDEYYVDFVEEEDETIEVTESSIVFLQRLEIED